MTARLSDLDGRTFQFRLLGFTRTDPPRLIVVERGEPQNSSWHYFTLAGQRAMLVDYREVPAMYAHQSELGAGAGVAAVLDARDALAQKI